MRTPAQSNEIRIKREIHSKLPSAEDLSKEYYKGFSSGELAKKYDVSNSTILRNLKRSGVVFRSLSESRILVLQHRRERIIYAKSISS